MTLIRFVSLMIFVSFSAHAQDLVLASLKGDMDEVKERCCSNINMKNEDGLTPLIAATMAGHADVVEFLLGQNPDVRARQKDWMSAFHFAVMNGYLEIAKLLAAHGADLEEKFNEEKVTPLLFAVMKGDTEMARWLIEKGVNVNTASENGAYPLFMAAGTGNMALAELLVAKGANPNQKTKDGLTAAGAAQFGGYREIIELFKKKK